LLLPLLVDEVLLGHGDAALKWMNHLLPRLAGGGRLYRPDAAGHPDPALAALAFNVVQARLFAGWPRTSSTACASA
jgi:ATP-binding cassette subfamily C protein